jgi:transposase InsO family protein
MGDAQLRRLVQQRRIYESLDYVPPVEFETVYYDPGESESLPVLEMI